MEKKKYGNINTQETKKAGIRNGIVVVAESLYRFASILNLLISQHVAETSGLTETIIIRPRNERNPEIVTK